eukprot:gene11001-7644_t
MTSATNKQQTNHYHRMNAAHTPVGPFSFLTGEDFSTVQEVRVHSCPHNLLDLPRRLCVGSRRLDRCVGGAAVYRRANLLQPNRPLPATARGERRNRNYHHRHIYGFQVRLQCSALHPPLFLVLLAYRLVCTSHLLLFIIINLTLTLLFFFSLSCAFQLDTTHESYRNDYNNRCGSLLLFLNPTHTHTQMHMPSNQTVEVIASKIGFETVIPVMYVASKEVKKQSKYKPYDIIDGKNPLDAEDPNHPRQPSDVRAPGAVTSSPLVGCPRPCRPGWAATRLAQGTPYSMLHLEDLEVRPQYVPDDEDYEWCSQHRIDPADLAGLFTKLEWRYVAHVLAASGVTLRGDMAAIDGQAPETPPDGTHDTPLRKSRGRPKGSGRAKRTTLRRSSLHQDFRSTTTTTTTNVARSGCSSTAGQLCAVCCTPVEPLPERPLQTTSRGGNDVHLPFRDAPHSSSSRCSSSSLTPLTAGGFPCRSCGLWAHTHCWCLPYVTRHVSSWTCDACFLMDLHQRKSTLRCVLCARSGGVMIPFVSSPASDTTGAGGASIAGGSLGSTLQSYVSAAIVHHQDRLPPGTDGLCHVICALGFPEVAIHSPPTPLEPEGLMDRRSRPFGYPLPIPDGAARRFTRCQQRTQLCVFCQRESGVCVPCGYPKCLENMHPSCACEARSLECFATIADRAAAGAGAVAVKPETAGGAEEKKIRMDKKGNEGCAMTPPTPTPTATHWSSCVTYCPHHNNVSTRGRVDGRLLSEDAERGATAADAAELLREARAERAAMRAQDVWRRVDGRSPSPHSSSGTSSAPATTSGSSTLAPQKRPRGRPPSAASVQREACRPISAAITLYWLQKRRDRRTESLQKVSDINAGRCPPVTAALHPEIIKISSAAVRLSQFQSLISAWQLWLVKAAEHQLPIPDVEYDDPTLMRRAAAAGPDGAEVAAVEKLRGLQDMAARLETLTAAMRSHAMVRHQWALTEAALLEKRCRWSEDVDGAPNYCGAFCLLFPFICYALYGGVRRTEQDEKEDTRRQKRVDPTRLALEKSVQCNNNNNNNNNNNKKRTLINKKKEREGCIDKTNNSRHWQHTYVKRGGPRYPELEGLWIFRCETAIDIFLLFSSTSIFFHLPFKGSLGSSKSVPLDWTPPPPLPPTHPHTKQTERYSNYPVHIIEIQIDLQIACFLSLLPIACDSLVRYAPVHPVPY